MGTGSGATPAVATSAVVSSYNNYEFAQNSSGQLYSTFGIYGAWNAWSRPSELGAAGSIAVAFSVASSPDAAPLIFAVDDRRQCLLCRSDELGDLEHVCQPGHAALSESSTARPVFCGGVPCSVLSG